MTMAIPGIGRNCKYWAVAAVAEQLGLETSTGPELRRLVAAMTLQARCAISSRTGLRHRPHSCPMCRQSLRPTCRSSPWTQPSS